MAAPDTIEILTIEGKPWRVIGAKFEAMRLAFLEVIPDEAPGKTFAELKAALLPLLDAELFSGGEKAGWWLKSMQLDHEARGIVKRTKGSPLRFYRT